MYSDVCVCMNSCFFQSGVLLPCGNKLVTPTLSSGQQLDASVVHKIFKRAPLYIRPSVALEVSSRGQISENLTCPCHI